MRQRPGVIDDGSHIAYIYDQGVAIATVMAVAGELANALAFPMNCKAVAIAGTAVPRVGRQGANFNLRITDILRPANCQQPGTNYNIIAGV